MAGVDQFLGAQLDKQAKALSELVVKMTEMIKGIDASIPKYAESSETVQVDKDGESGGEFANDVVIKLFMDGTINLEITFNHGSTGSVRHMYIYRNEIKIIDIAHNGTSQQTRNYDIAVSEGDNIRIGNDECRFDLYNYKVKYDLIDKPQILT